MGLVRGELIDVHQLVAECGNDGHDDFFLSLTPLPVPGEVGPPANGSAIK
jgi:hypothetical protein